MGNSLLYHRERRRMYQEDTIAAIATAMTPSGIGIVRMSGPKAIETAEKVFRLPGGKQKTDFASHTIHYGHILDGDTVIDEVMLLVMKAPRSYTTEDTVEIDCHGGPQVMRRILQVLLKSGARAAEPGEFTKRAFLNGRIDLSSAEAVSDLIYAENDFAQENAISQLRGSVYRKITGMRETILEETAYIEAALDDPEHYSLEGYACKLEMVVQELIRRTERMISSYRNGSLLKEGIRVVIVGKPNAGKSSWMNLLSGQEKAIVTEIAGTTRDTIEEKVRLGTLTLRIMDTAGIRETQDRIEQIGVERARQNMTQADLILYVVDASLPLDENDRQICLQIAKKPALILLNKSDLACAVTETEIKNLLLQTGAAENAHRVLKVSALLETGLSEIEQEITDLFFDGVVSFNNEVTITNERQVAALQETRQSLQLAEEGIRAGMSEEFLSIDLMNAYEALGKVIGESVGEDLINEIFGKFCMGK